MSLVDDRTRAGEAALVDDVVATREQLRDQARATLGVTGDRETKPFRQVLREHRLSVYPIVALGLLYITDTFQSYAFTVLTPNISYALGIGITAIAGARTLQSFFVAVAPLPVAAWVQNHPRRAALCIATGVLWSLTTLYTGFVTSLLGLIGILCLDGLTTGSVTALHAPLIMDSYHPEGRVRALSAYSAFGTFGQVLSPLFVAALADWAGFTWRGVFLAMGLTSLAFTLCSLGLRDPGYGKWDTDLLRESVHELHHDDPGALKAAEVALGFWEICRRVLLVPTNRRLYTGFAVFGLLVIPLQTFMSFFLYVRWGLGPGGRGAFFAYYAAVGVIALVLYGNRGEKQFREDPAKLLRTAAVLLAVAVAFVGLGGVVPVFAIMLICFGIAGAVIFVFSVGLGITLMSIIPAHMRPHAQALVGIFLSIGSLIGVLLLGSVTSQFGAGATMIAVAIPGLISARIVYTAARTVQLDLDRMIDEVLEDEEIRRLTRAGERLPMLSCRGINFSYGQLQVLFGVDFTVDDGEMVALLGVNGAGKSTLLKVISGIGLPSAGSVRYRGQDITFLDAERRLRLGITQIPGGRAVFGPMTVVDNLRSFGYTVGRNRRTLDAAIDSCFEAFPRLAERRNSLAVTLSGGEQQMLGLSKALILRPQLLLIDELSLGLAPVIVGQLLEMVERINATGTAVVLVEQSVNIALSLCRHAYFMEKGEMRFDGSSADLLAREDLLRAVFLSGATAATGQL